MIGDYNPTTVLTLNIRAILRLETDGQRIIQVLPTLIITTDMGKTRASNNRSHRIPVRLLDRITGKADTTGIIKMLLLVISQLFRLTVIPKQQKLAANACTAMEINEPTKQKEMPIQLQMKFYSKSSIVLKPEGITV